MVRDIIFLSILRPRIGQISKLIDLYRPLIGYLKEEFNLLSSCVDFSAQLGICHDVVQIIKCIRACEGSNNGNDIYLPSEVSSLLLSMIEFRFKFDKLNCDVASPRKAPPKEFSSSPADNFKEYNVHTSKNLYHADVKGGESSKN